MNFLLGTQGTDLLRTNFAGDGPRLTTCRGMLKSVPMIV